MRYLTATSLFLFVTLFTNAAATRGRVQPDLDALRKMSLDELAAQVPTGSGFYFIGCPNCDGGSQESGVLAWQPGMGDTVRCNYCGMIFPNEKFTDNKSYMFKRPDGSTLVYRYHESPAGRQYFFEAHAWFERTMWLRASAEALARRYAQTGDLNSADRAATILARFAQVVPGYAVKFDFPFRAKRFWPADQKWPYADDIDSYRGSKFDWWGYQDIPEDLGRAWKALSDGHYDWSRLQGRFGPDPNALIQTDLLRLLVDFTAANRETYHNMSPRMYRGMINMGRWLNEPRYVHDAVDRFRTLVEKRFFADGWWMEGAPAYHAQTVGNLEMDAAAARGYTDPPSWTGEKFTDLDLMSQVPLLARAIRVLHEGVLPNGRMIPINDTWPNSRVEPTTVSQARLWPGLGQALLGAGRGANQVCLGLNWSGNYGHAHADNGSIFLYALGHELLPDIGYTHTRWRNWALNSASHNMAVVDEKSQAMAGPNDATTQGNLRWFDAADPHVQMIDLDASPSYPDAKTYRRRLALVHAGEGFDYVIDRVDIDGGKVHDLFIHGSADEAGRLETSIPTKTPVASLIPAWGARGQYVGESDIDLVGKKFHAYGFLNDVHSAPAGGIWNATWRYRANGLRAYMIPPRATTAYRYMSPMIRPAGNLDASLPKHMTPGVMQRHAGPTSAFMTVYEPFGKNPWIESVAGDADKLTVTYTLGGKRVTDTIALGAESLSIKSSAGWGYRTGKPAGGNVAGIESDGTKHIVRLDTPAPAATGAVRLNFGPKRSFVFPVARAEGTALELAVDPGIALDGPDAAHFVSFPYDKLSGKITWTVYR